MLPLTITLSPTVAPFWGKLMPAAVLVVVGVGICVGVDVGVGVGIGVDVDAGVQVDVGVSEATATGAVAGVVTCTTAGAVGVGSIGRRDLSMRYPPPQTIRSSTIAAGMPIQGQRPSFDRTDCGVGMGGFLAISLSTAIMRASTLL